MPHALCILGMHRSGTSLVAQLLEGLGVDFGPREELLDANAANPRGYWEIERIVHANEWILQTLGRRWDTAFPLPEGWHTSPELDRHRTHVRTVLEELFGSCERFGWKDPRCCLTLPLWRESLADLGTSVHFVLVLRNPLDVARSLARRNDFTPEGSLGLWYHYTLQALVGSAGQPRAVVCYEDLLDRPIREVERLSRSLSLDGSAVETTVRQAVDPKLCHSRSDPKKLDRQAPVHVVSIYRSLLAALEGEISWDEVDREAQVRLRDLERHASVLRHDREREVRESTRIEHLESELRNLRTRIGRTEELETELEGIYASAWWQWADRYWRFRRWLRPRAGGLVARGRSAARRLRSATGHRPFARVTSPWDFEEALTTCSDPCFCNLCWWAGEAFEGRPHSESAVCPDCGSIARDRFLFFCFVTRTPRGRYRVLETSPRLGAPYRQAMRTWLDYRASDFDLRAHRADVQLDLQDIHLEPGSVDVLLTPHVLEHVPDTARALNGIHRLLAPEGRMYLQVPLLQGKTARPVEPEVHGDDTPVEWRFGPDLTQRLGEHGFDARLLCPRDLHRRVIEGESVWDGPTSPEFDVGAILSGLREVELSPVADDATSRRLGFRPSYMFLTWEAAKRER